MFAARSSTYDQSARGPDPVRARSRHGWGIHAVLAAVLALVVTALAAPAASAQQQNWPCDAFGYLFQARSATGPYDIVQVDIATGEQTVIGNTPEAINAAGYNAVDNFFYGMQYFPAAAAWRLARVHPDGTVDDLGVPTGPGGIMASVGASYPIGEVDPNGHYWAIDTVSQTWYEVDLTTPTPILLRSGAVTLPAPNTGVGADWSWINGALYTFGGGAPDGSTHLLRFDLATTTFSDLGAIGAGEFGASFSDASGYLYGSQNATGDIYRIDPATRQTIIASDAGQVSPGNDGARCALAVVPTITVTKTVNGRVRAADQFTVGLLRPDGSTADTATTSGSGTTASTTNFPASQGKTYTITDAMAANSPTPFGEYVKSIECKDADGNPAPTGGSPGAWTLLVANPTFYTCNVTNAAVSDLELAKSASPSPVVPGEDVTWTLTVTNKGPSTSIGETVTDTLPAEVTFASASAGCSEAGGTVTCAVGELAAGASKTFTITGQVASSLDKCLRNTGTVTGQFDPDSSNNTSTICTPIEGRSNLSITKTASSATVAAGGQVMYTLVVRNNGPSDDPNVSVSDPLPAGLALVSAAPSQGTCTTTNNVVSCELGALKDRGSAQVLVTANLTASAATCGSGSVTNTARVQGAHEDPNPDNNQASAQICGDPPPDPRFDLSSTKTMVTKGKIYVGQTVTYRIVVANKGPDAAPGAKMTDTLNAPATLVSVETTAGSCTDAIPVTCSLGTIAAGDSVTITMKVKHREASKRQTNAASVTGEGTDLVPGDNIDKITKTVRKVTIKVTKVASSRSVSAGGRVSYTIRVKNTSKGVARNVKTCDRLPSGMAFTSSTPKAKKAKAQRCWTAKRLKAGQTKRYKVTVRVASGANGNKVNRATVRSPTVKPASARRPVRVRGVATPVTG
jgi:uncharacterized repeat protein (TIGR01451 family)